MGDVVQRWRIVYARGAEARALGQREELDAWETAVLASGLPAVGAGTGRPRLTFAVPLPAGLDADAERLDIGLAERRTRADVRTRLQAHVPVGHALLDVHDVWVGEPALTGRVTAMDYALTLDAGVDGEVVSGAAQRLLAASTLPRVRRRAERETAYDLRPFLLGLRIEGGHEAAVVVRVRLRVDPEQGTGRPDELLAALGDAAGMPIAMAAGRRERIWLVDEAPTEL